LNRPEGTEIAGKKRALNVKGREKERERERYIRAVYSTDRETDSERVRAIVRE
jgi:hypothetical protein